MMGNCLLEDWSREAIHAIKNKDICNSHSLHLKHGTSVWSLQESYNNRYPFILSATPPPEANPYFAFQILLLDPRLSVFFSSPIHTPPRPHRPRCMNIESFVPDASEWLSKPIF